MTLAIEVKHLNFSYPDNPILKNVSFTIHENESISIIGPNGGGKSTLLKLLTGLLKPASGSIKIFGQSPEQATSLFAYVPQSLGFDRQFPISVLEVVLSGRLSHLSFWGKWKKEDIHIAHEMLAKVGLANHVNSPFSHLSGGQIQRVLIARALATKPKLLILDEPTASIDSAGEADILSLLKTLKDEKEGLTFLMVTHDLNQAVYDVNRLLVVQGGVASMSVKEVCEHFAMGLYHTPMLQADHPLIQLRRSNNGS